MNKKYIKFIYERFIPKMREIGYTEESLRNGESFYLRYKDFGSLIISMTNKHTQIVMFKKSEEKRLMGFYELSWISDDELEKEKMKYAHGTAFYHDNYFEFEGLFNYVFQVLNKYGEDLFSEKLLDKIDAKKEEKRIKFYEDRVKTLMSGMQESEEWRKNIRFKEPCYHLITL